MAAAIRSGVLGGLLLVVGPSTLEADTIIWHFTGAVTGYSIPCTPGSDCGETIDSVVPIGTPIDVFVSINPDFAPPNPQVPCYRGTATTSMQVLGQTYSGTGHVWDEGWGFGPGVCQPGYNVIEIVAPSWGTGGPELADGWVPFGAGFDSFFPGLWWGGDLTSVQPDAISSQLPKFYKPRLSHPQRFTASLHAVPAEMHPVPEPTTWLLFSTGLAAAAWRRRRS